MTLLTQLDAIDTSRQRWSRPGELWPQGPVSTRAATPTALADVLGHVEAVEASLTEDPAQIHRLLRRLHVSRFVRWPAGKRRGTRLDALLAGDNALCPLTWRDEPPLLAASTVDALHSATLLLPTASTAWNVPVDLGAVFTATDVTFGGGTDLGITAEYTTGVTLDGIATWVGDLTAWFLAWYAQLPAPGSPPWTETQSLTALDTLWPAELPLELMLGSLDGTVLAAYYYATVTGVAGSTLPLADLMAAYYGIEPVTSLPHVSQRFSRFVAGATPVIPHQGSDDPVTLDPQALYVVQGYITRLAAFFLFHAQRDKPFGQSILRPAWLPLEPLAAVATRVEAQSAMIRTIATRFIDLLQTGLDGGAPPAAWPRRPVDP